MSIRRLRSRGFVERTMASRESKDSYDPNEWIEWVQRTVRRGVRDRGIGDRACLCEMINELCSTASIVAAINMAYKMIIYRSPRARKTIPRDAVASKYPVDVYYYRVKYENAKIRSVCEEFKNVAKFLKKGTMIGGETSLYLPRVRIRVA